MSEVTNFRGEVTSEPSRASSEAAIASFIRTVGDRVRAARLRKGISRRVLSEQSGISQRYLAQLEAGTGNISIALLLKVAHALDHKVEWLVGEDDPWGSETMTMAQLFRTARSDVRQRVMQMLDPGQPGELRRHRICLLGLRGAGKSTLGKLAGEALSLQFDELNIGIEEQSGMPVAEVMALYGQEGYRKLERQALERVVATTDDVLLAVAGGIVSEPETYAFLLRHFHTIWLKASPQEHMHRVRAQGDNRPMTGNAQAMEELVSILTSRETLYARADHMIDTTGRTVDESLKDLLQAVESMNLFAETAPRSQPGEQD